MVFLVGDESHGRKSKITFKKHVDLKLYKIYINSLCKKHNNTSSISTPHLVPDFGGLVLTLYWKIIVANSFLIWANCYNS